MTLVTVLSASGRPGLAQVRQLLKAGYSVRATTRNPERMSKFDGVEVVSADYNDPDPIYEACVGADTVFYTRPSFEESHKALDFAATVEVLLKEQMLDVLFTILVGDHLRS